MKTRTMASGTRGWVAGVMLALLTGATAVAAGQTVDERLAADKEGSVEIENVSGSVDVEGWSRAEVTVKGTLGEGVEELRVERSGDRIEIEVIYDDGDEHGSSHLTIQVPEASEVNVEAVSADVTVRSLKGDVEVDAVSGDVRIEATSKEIDIEAVSGDIRVQAVDGRVEAASVSGDVEVELRNGEFDAETVSGDIEVRAQSLVRGDGQAVSGDFQYDGGLAKGGRLDLESHSGDVELRLPADVSADVELEAYSGDMHSDFSGQQQSERSWEFTLGDGKARVEVTTFSGDIEVRRK